MSDTITACENVCQDFSWLPPVMEVFTPILAAAVALIIAFVAYPWQKRKDREMQIASEQRECYAQLIDAAESFHGSVFDGDQEKTHEKLERLNSSVYRLSAYGSDEMVDIALELRRAAIKWAGSALFGDEDGDVDAKRNDFRNELAKMTSQMRRELYGANEKGFVFTSFSSEKAP